MEFDSFELPEGAPIRPGDRESTVITDEAAEMDRIGCIRDRRDSKYPLARVRSFREIVLRDGRV